MSEREDAIRAELERLQRRNKGMLTPDVVVDAARDPESILHETFDWDDTEAAHKWRLEQARQLIRVVVKFTVAPDTGKVYQVRAFTSLPADRSKGGGYRYIDTVLAEPNLRVQLLRAAKDDMERFCQKYATLTELADVFAAIDRVLATSAAGVA